jgi:hypothetical protein
MNDYSVSTFRDEVCLPLLLDARNADGGWGYQHGKQSATEPACWAILALKPFGHLPEVATAVRNATTWLRSTQLVDHSWPAFPGSPEGCWVTSLACLALHEQGGPTEAIEGGIEWICRAWPAEGVLWRRWLLGLTGGNKKTKLEFSLRGWSWTPGTSSWVEPTALTLIALHRLFPASGPTRIEKRAKLAEAMLYNRVCAGGGWNCGNPEVYGAPGEPLAGPTVWALLGLQRYRERRENRESLEWLSFARSTMQTPGSIALAHLCFSAYSKPSSLPQHDLEAAYRKNQFLGNTLVAAWCLLALADEPAEWLLWDPPEAHA